MHFTTHRIYYEIQIHFLSLFFWARYEVESHSLMGDGSDHSKNKVNAILNGSTTHVMNPQASLTKK
jgi:hypothetical protein